MDRTMVKYDQTRAQTTMWDNTFHFFHAFKADASRVSQFSECFTCLLLYCAHNDPYNTYFTMFYSSTLTSFLYIGTDRYTTAHVFKLNCKNCLCCNYTDMQQVLGIKLGAEAWYNRFITVEIQKIHGWSTHPP